MTKLLDLLLRLHERLEAQCQSVSKRDAPDFLEATSISDRKIIAAYILEERKNNPLVLGVDPDFRVIDPVERRKQGIVEFTVAKPKIEQIIRSFEKNDVFSNPYVLSEFIPLQMAHVAVEGAVWLLVAYYAKEAENPIAEVKSESGRDQILRRVFMDKDSMHTFLCAELEIAVANVYFAEAATKGIQAAASGLLFYPGPEFGIYAGVLHELGRLLPREKVEKLFHEGRSYTENRIERVFPG